MTIPPIPSEGTLIVGTAAPQVYLIENQQRHWIPDPITFESMGFDWNNIQQFPDAQVNIVPLGAPVPQLQRFQTSVSTDLGAGHFMTTSATLLSNGALTAFTRTQTVTWFGGFTGGVQVIMANADDVVIGASAQNTFGVDGRYVGVSDRNERWTESIDPAIASQTARLGVVHAWTPRVDTAAMVEAAITTARVIWILLQELNEQEGSGGGAGQPA